jgi:hypothetical protein
MDDGHGACRIRDFARWDRRMLEHEREHLSRAMTGVAFMQPEEADGLLHDITDIDYLLQYHPKRVQV